MVMFVAKFYVNKMITTLAENSHGNVYGHDIKQSKNTEAYLSVNNMKYRGHDLLIVPGFIRL